MSVENCQVVLGYNFRDPDDLILAVAPHFFDFFIHLSIYGLGVGSRGTKDNLYVTIKVWNSVDQVDYSFLTGDSPHK